MRHLWRAISPTEVLSDTLCGWAWAGAGPAFLGQEFTAICQSMNDVRQQFVEALEMQGQFSQVGSDSMQPAVGCCQRRLLYQCDTVTV
jgi:hypothetical protein